MQRDLTPDLPSYDPQLRDEDLHQCSEAVLRLLAAKEGMNIGAKVPTLRRQLIGRKRKLLAEDAKKEEEKKDPPPADSEVS